MKVLYMFGNPDKIDRVKKSIKVGDVAFLCAYDSEKNDCYVRVTDVICKDGGTYVRCRSDVYNLDTGLYVESVDESGKIFYKDSTYSLCGISRNENKEPLGYIVEPYMPIDKFRITKDEVVTGDYGIVLSNVSGGKRLCPITHIDDNVISCGGSLFDRKSGLSQEGKHQFSIIAYMRDIEPR